MSKFILPCKEVKTFVKDMRDEGWDAVGMARGSTHVIMVHENGARAQIPSTPSGDRQTAYKHARRRLRRLAATPPRHEKSDQ